MLKNHINFQRKMCTSLILKTDVHKVNILKSVLRRKSNTSQAAKPRAALDQKLQDAEQHCLPDE